MKVSIKPLEERLIVEIIPQDEDKTPGGIVIPESVRPGQRRPIFRANVIAVGNGEKVVKSGITVGSKVYVTPYAGAPFDRTNDNLLFLAYNDVMGIEEPSVKG